MSGYQNQHQSKAISIQSVIHCQCAMNISNDQPIVHGNRVLPAKRLIMSSFPLSFILRRIANCRKLKMESLLVIYTNTLQYPKFWGKAGCE